MRNKHILILLSIVAALAAVAVVVSAGNLNTPPGPPETTSSYTLEHIYDRLSTGVAGTQITFTEPISGPTVGTGHTLDEIMAVAPQVDGTNGAAASQVVAGTTYWGLQSGTWGLQTGAMPNNGAAIITPTTTSQTIAAGYHGGSGYVDGDADLLAGNIRSGVTLFGVDGTLTGGGTVTTTYIPKTGQTTSYATGDDGDLEKGVAWPIPRFITGTTGIVTDTLTGLIWLENANCFGQSTWTQALTDAATLNSGECGLSDGSVQGDWWLPNVRELQSLAHYGFYGPAVPNTTGTGQWSEADPFSGVQSYYYWSSTMHPYYADNFWSVHLGDGTVVRDLLTGVLYVWPVRGGQ